MTAELFRSPVPCGSCESTIPAGVPAYLVTVKRLIRCEACAKKFGVELPKAAPLSESHLPLRPDQRNTGYGERFNRFAMAQKVRHNILDWRARSSGEQAGE